MRRLAQALDREAMSLYRYAHTKAALLDGVVELVLSELTVNPAADDWRQELRELARDFRHLALAHPDMVPLLVTRPLSTPLGLRPPDTLRPVEDFLELLTHAGFTPHHALRAYRLFFGFLHGHILDELQEIVDNPEETDDLLRLGLHRLPRTQFPHLRALAPELASYDGAAYLDPRRRDDAHRPTNTLSPNPNTPLTRTPRTDHGGRFLRVHTVAEQPGSGQIVIDPRRMRLTRGGHRGHGVRRAP